MTTPTHDVVVRAALDDELSRPLAHVRQEFQSTFAAVGKGGATASAAARDYDRLAKEVLRTANAAGTLDNALQRQSTHAGRLGGSVRQLLTGYAALRVAQAGFNAVGDIESATTAFEGYVGSQKEAVALTKQLQGLHTPFGQSSLFSGAQSLLSFNTSKSQVVPYLRALSDAVAGTGGNASKLTAASQALAQLRDSTFLTSGALGQLQSQGLPAVDLLAKAHGMTSQALQIALDSGGLRISGQQAADELMTAFEDRYKGQAGKQAQTLKGVLATVGDSASRSLATAIAPELPQITAFVNTMAGELPGLAKAASPFLHVLGDTLGIMAAHPHLTEALGGFLLLRTAVGPAIQMAKATRDIAAGMAAISAAQGGGGLARSVLMSTVGLDGGVRAAGGAAAAESAAAQLAAAGGAGATATQAARAARASRLGARFGAGAGRLGGSAVKGGAAAIAGSIALDALGHTVHDGRLKTGGQAAGAIGVDAATGAALGSFIPIAGTGVGAVLGTGFGLVRHGGDLWHAAFGGGGGQQTAEGGQPGQVNLGGLNLTVGAGMTPDEVMAQVIPALRGQIQVGIDQANQQAVSRKQVPYS